jgi:hypothetical protein
MAGLLCRNIQITRHRTIIFPFVLCGCETWSLILSEGHELRVFENRVLGPKVDDITGEQRRLHIIPP